MNEKPLSPLEKALSRLPREYLPEADLWPGISRTILCHRRSRHVLEAGLVLVLTGILAFAVGLSPPLIPKRGETVRASRPLGMLAVFVSRAARDPDLPRGLRDSLPADFRALNQAQAALERLLARDPGAPALRSLLIEVETERARFLATVEEAQLHARNWQ